jgi:hypothetical protein
MLNRVDECRQRADECRRNAAQLVTDDVLRGAYLDLARIWRKMALSSERSEGLHEATKALALAVAGLMAITLIPNLVRLILY